MDHLLFAISVFCILRLHCGEFYVQYSFTMVRGVSPQMMTVTGIRYPPVIHPHFT